MNEKIEAAASKFANAKTLRTLEVKQQAQSKWDESHGHITLEIFRDGDLVTTMGLWATNSTSGVHIVVCNGKLDKLNNDEDIVSLFAEKKMMEDGI